MLVKHSALYLLARGVPGLVNFVAIGVYTRLLSPEDYGRYSLVITGIGLLNVVLFQWLRLSLLRFLPSQLDARPLLNTLLAGFLAITLGTAVVGVGIALVLPVAGWRWLLILGLPLLWSHAWSELNLDLLRSKLQPLRYGVASSLRSVISLGIGSILTIAGAGALGPLVGLCIGNLIGATVLTKREWKGVQPRLDPQVWARMLSYGLPLTATFALEFIVSSSDRFIVAYFLGERAAGVYSAGYNLAWSLITLLMMVVNSAAYPLAVNTLEKKGVADAQSQIIRNGNLLLLVSCPATAGLVVLARDIASVVLGEDFQQDGTHLIRWIALAALVAGVKSYHFDLAFQLGKHTLGQVWVTGVAAVTNLLLNWYLIPRVGIWGAAWSTLVAYALALGLSALMGRCVFAIYTDWRQAGKIVFSTLVMSKTLTLVAPTESLVTLLEKVGIGILTYSAAMLLTNGPEVQRHLARRTI